MAKRTLTILLILCAATYLAAQNDSIAPQEGRVIQYADTFQLDEHQSKLDLDLLLLDLVAKQSAELHEGDTAYVLTPEEKNPLGFAATRVGKAGFHSRGKRTVCATGGNANSLL